MFAAQNFNTRTYPLQKSLIPLSVFYRPGGMIKCIDLLLLMATLSSSITILYHYIPIYTVYYTYTQYDMHGCYIHYTNHGICQT